MRMVIGITGASGVIYGIRMLEVLDLFGVDPGIVRRWTGRPSKNP